MNKRVLLGAAALLIPAAAAVAQSGGVVTISNQSSWSIYQLYISPTSSNEWGPDLLGSTVISTGSGHTLMGVSCNSYDVKIVDEDSDECIINNVRLCDGQSSWEITNENLLACQAETAASSAPTPITGAGSYTPPSTTSSVEIVNNSWWSIYQLYLSPTSSSEWGPDQLGAEVISSEGDTFSLNGIPCDNYDVKIIDEDGDACEIRGISLCGSNQERWEITNENLLGCQNQ